MQLKPGEGTPPVASAPTVSAVPGASGTPLATAAPESSSHWTTQRTLALGAGGLGVAGFIVSGIAAAQASAKNGDSNANRHCNNSVTPNVCDPTGLQDRNDAKSLAGVATGALVASSVFAAGGIALWFTAPSANSSRTGRVELVPAAVGADVGLGLRGRW